MNTSSMLKNAVRVDQGSEAHDPRLYETSTVVSKVDGFEAITEEHLDFYRQEGRISNDGTGRSATRRSWANPAWRCP